MNQVSIQHHRTGIGELILGCFGGSLCLVGFHGETMRDSIPAGLGHRLQAGFVEQDDEILARTRQQIDEYLNGRRREFDVPLLLVGTAFQKSVWEALLKVPYGATSTYKRIAENVGSQRAVRAVGNACKANPIAIIVPCHRIIGSTGGFVGYGRGLPLKKRLLKLERGNDARSDGQVNTAQETDRSVPG